MALLFSFCTFKKVLKTICYAKRKKGIGQSAAKFCFCCHANSYLAIKIEKVQRLGSDKCTAHECQSLTIMSLLKLD